MNLTALSNILISMLFTGQLAFIVFWFYRRYRVAKYRSDLFNIRNDLFDDAADGLLEFDHPAYTMLRTLINGHLRFAHKITLWQPLTLFLIDKIRRPIPAEGITFDLAYSYATHGLEASTVNRLKEYRERLETRTLNFLCRSPAEFLLLVLPIISVSALYALFQGRLNKTFSIAGSAVESRVTDSAYALGQQNAPLALAA